VVTETVERTLIVQFTPAAGQDLLDASGVPILGELAATLRAIDSRLEVVVVSAGETDRQAITAPALPVGEPDRRSKDNVLSFVVPRIADRSRSALLQAGARWLDRWGSRGTNMYSLEIYGPDASRPESILSSLSWFGAHRLFAARPSLPAGESSPDTRVVVGIGRDCLRDNELEDFDRLLADIRALDDRLTVLSEDQFAEMAMLAAEALAPRLLEAEAPEVERSLAAFDRVYPGHESDVRQRAFGLDVDRRVVELCTLETTDARVELLERTAIDYGRSERPVPPRSPNRYDVLRAGGHRRPAAYAEVWEAAWADPEAQRRAPLPEPAVMGGPGVPDVLSIILPAAAGALTKQLVDIVIGWVRKRRQDPPDIVRIYGADGTVLHEAELKPKRKRKQRKTS
jgi:hypothetical protein